MLEDPVTMTPRSFLLLLYVETVIFTRAATELFGYALTFESVKFSGKIKWGGVIMPHDNIT
jgi:hypothetical protein